MKTSLAFAAALIGAAIATTAPAQAQNFQGPYVGVTAGWDRGEVADRTIAAQPVDAQASRDSLVLGGYAGYNYKLTDKVVIGAEAGFQATVDDRIRGTSAGQGLTVDPRYSFDFTARAGYLVTDKTLVYVRGGYANNRVRTALQTPGGIVRESDNLDGWIVGGGVEYAITDRISARAEYRYSDFGRNGGQYERHQTLFGVSYNF
jgi:outer membrane immunogenic protein